jgi:7-cyano-7-deazaguanine reductase
METLEQVYGIVKIEVPTKRVLTQLTKKTLEVFDNPRPGNSFRVEIECPEFTCLCPKTHQPDFATILLTYVPNEVCVELKALKYYLNSFRDEGHFHEQVTNLIWSDLFSILKPKPCSTCSEPQLRVEGSFNVRGGTYPYIAVGCPHVKDL